MQAFTRVQTYRTRLGNAVPALVSWVVVIGAVLGLVYFPLQGAWFAVAVFAYFVVWMSLHLVFYLVGDKRVREWRAKDWSQGRDAAGPDGIAPADVWHVVLLPNHTEPVAVLHRTLDSLAAQADAATRMVVVLGMEEREAGARAKGETVARDYAGKFARVLITMHPCDLPGELACKAANMRWAAREAMRELDAMGVDTGRVTLTACDADSVFDPSYFAAVADLFARDERRYSRFWQAPLFYYSNLWQVPAPVRFTARMTHFYMLGELALPGYDPLPISTYTLSMRMARECDWWDPAVIAEDWHVYLDYMVQRHGDVSMVPVYLPVWLDSAEGTTWFGMIHNRYVQLQRHCWGASDVGFLVEQLLSGETEGAVWFRFVQVLHDHVLPVAGFFIATSLAFVPTWLLTRAALQVPAAMGQVTLIEELVAGLFVVSTAVMLSAMVIDLVRFRPQRRGVLPMVLEVAKMYVLLPVAGLVFGAVPELDAQTKLALGVPLEWKVTTKGLRAGARPPREPAPASASDRDA